MGMYLSELISKATGCIKDIGLSPGTVRVYQCSAFNPIEKILGNPFVTSSDMIYEQESFFLNQYSDQTISRSTYNWRIRGVRILVEVFDTGGFQWKVFSKREQVSLPKKYEKILDQYMKTQDCSEKRKSCKRSICKRFLLSLANADVLNILSIQPCHVKEFIIDISKTRPKSMDDVISALRDFFRFLCEEGMIDNNHWMLLSAPKCRDHRVRDGLSSDEVSNLLSSIPRDTPSGKRDFAAMALAMATGLRAGDIANLTLDNIDWKKNELRIIQGKTSSPLVLPMSRIILNVLADYIINGRPDTVDRHVFVRHCAPFRGYHDGVSIACIFRKQLKKSGILHSVGDGKTLHGMRRGLGTGMAVNGVPVDVIAQVLGHAGIKATRHYISEDLEQLRKCALDFQSLGGDS